MAVSRHGFVRGASLARESRSFEGRFGRMFRSLPALDLDPANADVRNLVEAMTRVRPEKPATGEDYEGVMAQAEGGGPTAETDDDGEEGTIPAGYTYLGQFIDHDLTFDPASSLQRQNDPEALVDFRTPRFDLDSIYGRGPDDQPYMYDSLVEGGDLKLFLLGEKIGGPKGHNDLGAVDHLRASPNSSLKRRALIGDKRNDENTIVAQLHTIFLRFHNRIAKENPTWGFAEIQREVRWHYQWVVLHDYLKRIVGWQMVTSILPHLVPGGSIFTDTPKLRHYAFDNDPFLPTEFSTAAFRFGHSMVRPVYRLSRGFQDIGDNGFTKPDDITDNNVPPNSRRLIFDFITRTNGLNGFDTIIPGWAIEWDLFFGDVQHKGTEHTPGRVQPAYKVDTSLVNPLATLPEFMGKTPDANLAYRNLLRGFAMRLPSGEDVARAMSEPVLPPEWLVIGKAEEIGKPPEGRQIASFELKEAGPKPKISYPFADHTPLWLYILCEGARNATEGVDHALGPVGGRIVAETMIGLMLGDKHSFLRQDPNWIPMGGEGFDMKAFIDFATG